MSSLFDFDVKPDQYAVMGNPIQHSKSPLIHSRFAKQTDQNIEYSAIQVDEGGFKQAVGNFQAANGKGLNITLPFKQEAWALVDQRSERAQTAGAVNTIICNDDGTLYGDNTDGAGLIKDIIKNHRGVINNKSILLLGAGGAARGVLSPLLDEQPKNIVIANRTIDNAVQLADSFSDKGDIIGCGFDMFNKNTFGASKNHAFDIIINATSASLNNSLPPIPSSTIHSHTIVYDMMYGKEPTIFMNWAIENGCTQAIDGLGMLVEQAAESFYLWRKVKPDTQAVIDLLRNRFSD